MAKGEEIHVGKGPSITIVGGGVGGIILGLELDRRGLTNWMIYERHSGVGGTWWANQYPGCRCDVPAVAYSHSRFQTPEWTQSHPPRDEIQQYWEGLTKSNNLWPRIKLNHNFDGATWDPATHSYDVRLTNRETNEDVLVNSKILIDATGIFSTPREVDIEGASQFHGRVVHSGRWPSDLKPEDMRGKRVVVVGNGCSGVQIMGQLGFDPKITLINIAKAGQWFVPGLAGPQALRNSVPYPPEKNDRWRRFPALQHFERWLTYIYMDNRFKQCLVKDGAKTRQEMGKQLMAWYKQQLPEYMHEHLQPPFEYAAKRPIYEDGYFHALRQPQNKFIWGRVEKVTPTGVLVDDGQEVEADIVIFASGYDADTIPFDIVGSTDATSNYNGRAELTMYRGIALPGMPNYFSLLGNNMCLNHSSVTSVLEIQANYLGQIVQGIRDYSLPEVEVKRSAAEKYDSWIEKRLNLTNWLTVNNYWRKDGNGRLFTHYPNTVLHMWWDHHSPIWTDFIGAEKIVRWQRIKRLIIFVLALVAGRWTLNHTARGIQVREISKALLGAAVLKIQSYRS